MNRTVVCQRCGTAFPCGENAEGTCWCQKLPPVAPLPKAATRSEDCLCPTCLQQLHDDRRP